MKRSNLTVGTLAKVLALGLAVISFGGIAKAHPYASGVTNDNGTVRFILNEGGGTVQVVFEDGTTNVMGVLGKGAQSFPLSIHTSYSIYVTKTGNGTPSLISTDSAQFSIWNSPRGVDANKNPKLGYLFGRTYVGNSAVGGTSPNNKGKGLYALNADLSDSPLGHGANATGGGIFAGSGISGPWRMRIAPDNTVLVDDFSTADAALWQFDSDLTSSNLVLSIVGQTAAAAAGIHGDMFGTPLITGSLAASNLVLWTADSGMAVPNATIAPSITLGPGTSRGSFNCLFRYDIGAGPLPWNNPPNYAYTLGLDGIAELRTEIDLGKDGKIIGGFGRANLSNGNIQILDPTGATILYNSLNNAGTDPWNGINGAGAQVGTYCGVRVSPDGRFLASVDIQNGITIANLTNGIPDESSIFGIQNSPNTTIARGMCWDAADNIYVVSSGQGLLRVFSLGISTTCITSNDFTGTNGSFQLVLPNVAATVVASQPLASQHYINSVPAGTPIPGAFTIGLDKNHLDAPVVVNFTRSGTAAYLTNYTINLGTDVNGVIISSNSVTFPAGNMPGGGNWSANVQIIPTATPLSGPTLTVGLRVLGGANYLAGTPLTGTVFIANTGPQVLILSAAASGTTMSRGIVNDYARFFITRWGDTNGPGSTAAITTPALYTVTNFTYLGTAAFPADYTAQAQRTDPAGNGVIVVPSDGAPGIVINPGDVVITNVIGNPVAHANLNLPPTDVTIVISLTNSVTGTNAISLQGDSYAVSNNAVTLTELDNTFGPEVVLWSNPLISSVDSTNWTLTFASTGFATNTQLPVVIPNYTNDIYSLAGGGTNDFNVKFGWPVANDSVLPSPAMTANGWANALRMTVNKSVPAEVCGVNLYPQGMSFRGNYALRFSMYLSVYSGAINNPSAGTTPREFAAFGINHFGTNCNWRLATPINQGQGSGTTNADGVWFAINAASQSPGSITPADFDAFTSPALPNAGVAADLVSFTASQETGIFKSPPFVTVQPLLGGTPANQWVDVSVEVTKQTNATIYMNRAQVITPFSLINGGSYTNGTPMLGYLDPVSDLSDNTAFVYYSNVRVVELSPFIYAQAASLIVTQGANVSFTSSAAFATAPITNTWYIANTNPFPVLALQTNTANATNLTSTLSLNNVQIGTNYVAVFSDLAGSVTGLVRSLEVITPPVSITTNTGATIQFVVGTNGPAQPTFQWKTNGVNLANSTHYAGVTTGTLTITNVGSSDAKTYSVGVTNAAGGFSLLATLTVNTPLPPTFSTVSLVGTNVVLAFGSPNAYDTTTSFILQSSTVVQGPYTNTPGIFTGANGTFQVTSPQTGSNRFYRLLHI